MASRILIIDDEEGIRLSLRGILEDEGYEVLEASSAEQGLDLLERARPDLIFLDIWLPGMDGLEALPQIKARFDDIPVIMISGHGTIETAVNALRLGAHDFIEKPLSLEKVLIQVRNGLEMNVLRRENQALRVAVEQSKDSIVGQSPPIRRLLRDIAQVAPTEAGVLITGENGTGKELAARAVHRASRRAAAPLVAVNCAAIPEELIESELFGHEKGAFTGADAARAGKFELAHQGTLFLDEIGDMSLKTQAKILRILEDQTCERVGGARAIRINVRIIAATNKNLEEAMSRGEFREDLYYRLRVFPLHVPPLRERLADLPLLAAALSARAEKRVGCKAPLIGPEAMEALAAWHWPGNVRELAHLIERLAILYPGGNLGLADLPSEFQGLTLPARHDSAQDAQRDRERARDGDEDGLRARLLAPDLDFKSARALFETWFLERKLAEAKGNITRLADMVGLERSYVHRKLKAGKDRSE